MPENLMNSSHKASTDRYRDGWDKCFGDKKRVPESGDKETPYSERRGGEK